MRYPTISRAKLSELAPALLATGTCSLDDSTGWSGDGEALDEAPLAALAQKVHENLEEFQAGLQASDRDLFEGRCAAELHEVLRDLPLLALDDPGFWRYLTLRYFWELAVWRESRTFEDGEYGKYRKYVDGTNPSECVLMRMFLRAQIALENGSYELAWKIPKGTDFWRSHILRVRTSSTPVVSRALVREQDESRMATEELRSFARRLNRIRTNVVLNVYEAEEAAALLAELRET